MTPQDLKRRRTAYLTLAVMSPLLLLALWVAATSMGWIRSVLLPGPLAVLATLQEMALHGYSGVGLLTHVGASLMRVGVAFVAGSLLGIAVGMLRGRVAAVDAVWLVPAELVRPIPPLGLIPLFILWFGIGETSKILLIFFACFAPVALAARAGVSAAAADQVNAARALGASRWQVVVHVVLPAALPDILVGLRIGMGVGWTTLVAAEMVAASTGIGQMVLNASNFLRTDIVLMGIFVIGAFAALFEFGMRWLERRLVPWKGKV